MMRKNHQLCLIALQQTFGIVSVIAVASTDTNTQLYDFLFNSYNKDVRPIEYTGQSSVVWVSPNLYSIIDVVNYYSIIYYYLLLLLLLLFLLLSTFIIIIIIIIYSII